MIGSFAMNGSACALVLGGKYPVAFMKSIWASARPQWVSQAHAASALASDIIPLYRADMRPEGPPSPEGIGAAQGKFLADGDVITTTIDGIGTMTNRCVRVSDYAKVGA